jgi:hypothetical protein
MVSGEFSFSTLRESQAELNEISQKLQVVHKIVTSHEMWTSLGSITLIVNIYSCKENGVFLFPLYVMQLAFYNEFVSAIN